MNRRVSKPGLVCSQSHPARDLGAAKRIYERAGTLNKIQIIPVAVREKNLLAMDEGEEELRLEARTVQDCSIAVSRAVAIPPCRPPWQ